MLPFLVAGLTTGSVFALAAVGLVLTYRTSGIFNFGHGAIASTSAFAFYYLWVEQGVPWLIAAALVVVLLGPALGILLSLMANGLTGAPLSRQVLAMVGVLLALQGSLDLLFPPGPARLVPQFLPTKSFDVAGTAVGANQVITFSLGALATVALAVFLRRSRAGLAMSAVVDNAELLACTGTSPRKTRRVAWVIGSMFAASSGVLIAPLLPLDATSITFMVVTAFGAAAIGGFTRLPVAYLGGLAIGIGQALLQKYFVDASGISGGLSSSLPFLVLFGVLIAAPRLRRPAGAGAIRSEDPARWSAPVRLRLTGAMFVIAVLVAVPQFAGTHLLDWTRFLAYVVLFLALGLLVRTSGQVSLAHVSFMAIGAATFSHLADDQGVPWFVALFLAAAVAAPIGALLAIPAIRFPGLYLALATLGFGFALQQMFYGQNIMFGDGFGRTIPRPSSFGFEGDLGYYYLALIITIAVAVLVAAINASRLGRLLAAMSDSPVGLQACGASINVTRVLVFCLSASLGAVAGVLDGGVLGLVGGDQYQPFMSVQMFAVLMISVGGAPWYAILAAAAQVLLPAYVATGVTVGHVLTAVFGLGAILFATAPAAFREAPHAVTKHVDRIFGSHSASRGLKIRPRMPYPSTRPLATADLAAGLEVNDLTVRFGGLVAADSVTLSAPLGRITGVIGPNGAGKSTVLAACSGLVSSHGRITLNQRDLQRSGTASRARAGLGRTFQRMELFDTLNVLENIELGAEAGQAGWNPFDHIIARPRLRSVIREAAANAIDLCGLTEFADRKVGTLSTGQRRMVELARCLVGGFGIILLDEPSSGLDKVETERFGRILQEVVERTGVGVLIVEHDMALITGICDYVHVLDFGTQIFEGPVRDVIASPIVRSAYLGETFGSSPTPNARGTAVLP